MHRRETPSAILRRIVTIGGELNIKVQILNDRYQYRSPSDLVLTLFTSNKTIGGWRINRSRTGSPPGKKGVQSVW